jgi:putative transposase
MWRLRLRHLHEDREPGVDMEDDRGVHHRRSIRLRGYDYAYFGAYFVTLCIQDRVSLLGTRDGAVFLPTAAGEMVQRCWACSGEHYPAVNAGICSVMPNHLHGIVLLLGQEDAAERVTPLGDVIKRFKAITTRLYAAGVVEQGWPPFNGRLWQRNYYEHIIRSDREMWAIEGYIANNPAQWAVDRENPANW